MLRAKKKIYYINPMLIDRAKGGRKDWKWYAEYHVRRYVFWPFQALRGNWDKIEIISGCVRDSEMNELFIQNLPYKETVTYRNLVEELERNGFTQFPRTHSLEQIDSYFERVYKVYNDIKNNGYKTCDELGLSKRYEIHVRITRQGQIVKCGEGTHRLAMARLLNMDNVPVVVDLVHSSLIKKWKKESRASKQDPVEYGLIQLSSRVSNP